MDQGGATGAVHPNELLSVGVLPGPIVGGPKFNAPIPTVSSWEQKLRTCNKNVHTFLAMDNGDNEWKWMNMTHLE